MNYFQSGYIPTGLDEDTSAVVPPYTDGPNDVHFQFEAGGDMGAGGYGDFDLSNVALPDLLHEINPNIMGDLRDGAPDAFRALMKQEPGSLDMPVASRTEDLGRAAAFIDDSAGPEQTGSRPMCSIGKTEAEFDDRLDTTTTTDKRRTAHMDSRNLSSASNAHHEATDSMGDTNSNGGGSAGGANQKALRAERNRQSAAASRERKKHHIWELERRVAMLSLENAQLQVDQIHTMKARIDEERKLTQENQRLRNQLVHLDMKINRLSKQMDEAGISGEKRGHRAKTWTSGDFSTTNASAKKT